jgi:hypothetical protein
MKFIKAKDLTYRNGDCHELVYQTRFCGECGGDMYTALSSTPPGSPAGDVVMSVNVCLPCDIVLADYWNRNKKGSLSGLTDLHDLHQVLLQEIQSGRLDKLFQGAPPRLSLVSSPRQ